MALFSSKSSFPLWAFVVVVVVGSLCILATLGIVIRCLVARKQARQAVGDEFSAPTRMMTVRRGRVVPQSHYLSLTGSRFGVNELENDASTTRSKSPFEWWNRVKQRNDSAEFSQRGSTVGAPSIISTNMSTTAVAVAEKSPADWASKIDLAMPSPALHHPRIGGIPSPNSSPNHSPLRTTFPRPLRSATPGSPFLFDARLSKIEEASPHQSIISSRQRSMDFPRSQSACDGCQKQYESQANSPLLALPPPPRESRFSSGRRSRSPNPRFSFELPASISADANSWHDASQLNALPAVDELEKEWPVIAPVQQHPPSNSTSPAPQRQQRDSHVPAISSPTPESRLSYPARTSSTSKKGKVLRKKSLKNMEIVSST